MKNLTLRNITTACQGTYHGDEALLDREVSNVVIDSRKVEKDALFVAIDGERFNAHLYPETIEKGALCVLFPRRPRRDRFPIYSGGIHRTGAS